MASILDSPMWKPATEAVEPFRKMHDLFVYKLDKCGGPFIQKLGITADHYLVARATAAELPVSSPVGATSSSAAPPFSSSSSSHEGSSAVATQARGGEDDQGLAFICAFPFEVKPHMCEGGEGEVQSMSAGVLCLLADMITSFHIMLARLPLAEGHVSVSMQVNRCAALELGKCYIAVARIDKLGRRLVYTSVDYIETQFPEGIETPSMESPKELVEALHNSTVVANVKHVKAIMSANTKSGDGERKK